MILMVFIGLLLLLHYGWLMINYVRHWDRLKPAEMSFQDSVSILIPFRNEAVHLPVLLDSIEALSYKGKFEVIMIDDHSTDESVAIIQKRNFNAIKLLHLQNAEGKKEAIRLAWKHCKHKIILHTDADCKLPTQWIDSMIAPLANSQVDFVSGPVCYSKRARAPLGVKLTFWRKLWHRWFQIDFVGLNVAGAAQISMNRALMCNGANLAYRSAKLGADLNTNYASGDDVFLMQHIQREGGGIFFQKDVRAVVRTEAPMGLKSFINQRLRWAGKNTSYGRYNTITLLFIWLFNLFMFIGIFNGYTLFGIMALCMLIVKIGLEAFLLSRSMKLYKLSSDAYSPLIIGQIAHIAYMALIPLASKILNYEWKGRKLK